MNKKTDTSKSGQGRPAVSERRLPSLRRYGFYGLLAALVVSLGIGLALFQLNRMQIDAVRTNQYRALAQGHLAKLSALLHQFNAVLDRWVQSPDLVATLESGDPEAYRARERELSFLFPFTRRVRLFEPSLAEATPEKTGSPPLSYAAIEMLRRTRESATPPPAEAHMFGTENQHFNIARRVENDSGELVGLLLASFPLDLLQSSLQRMGGDSDVRIELQQETEDNLPLILAAQGPAETKGLEAQRPLTIKGAIWNLVAWHPADAAPILSPRQILFLGVIGLGMLLLAAVFVLLFRRLAESMRKDQITVINLFEDMVNGDLQRQYPVSLANNYGTVELLQGIAKEYHSGEGASSGGGLGMGLGMERELLSKEPYVPENYDVETIGRSQGDERIPASIFRAYDIRGVVSETLTADIVREVGRSIGSECLDNDQHRVIVARDGRTSGQELVQALTEGLLATGVDVIDIGMVPTPVLYFATHYLGSNSGVMVTGSHNPPDYNGLKVVLNGETLYGEAIQALRRRIDTGNLLTGEGGYREQNLLSDYMDRVIGDVTLARGMKLIVDCGNGVAGVAAPELLRRLGCEVDELFCNVDGRFPNHHPNPSKPENLVTLKRRVVDQGADLGIAFDGDGDRLAAVDSAGNVIWPDRLLMLFAKDVLSRLPGSDIIYDIKCTRNLPRVIANLGGHPHMWKTGHSLLKAKVRETGAPLGGELSGHIVFQERWYGFDDAIYATARLLEILSADSRSTADIFAELPNSLSTPELEIRMREGQPFRLMERLLKKAQFPGAKITTLDGLRADFEDAWGLVRASNTTPSLTLRFEADNEEALRRIQDTFRKLLLDLDPNLLIPF